MWVGDPLFAMPLYGVINARAEPDREPNQLKSTLISLIQGWMSNYGWFIALLYKQVQQGS